MDKKRRIQIMYGWGLALIIIGLLFNYFGIGQNNFFEAYKTVGNWLIYVGFIGLMIATIKLLTRKKQKKVDERMEFIATKALRFTFLFLVFGAFIIIIIDGIKIITIPYHLFMSYLICILMLIYFAIYKILLRYN